MIYILPSYHTQCSISNLYKSLATYRKITSLAMNAFMTRFLRSPALSTIPIPKQEPGELLIKVAYVSLNPTDRWYSYKSA